MNKIRFLSVALLTLASAGALQAQTASFSVLGLSTLFGGDVEELSAPQRCEINMLPVFVSECMKRWQEQWTMGNYREAEKFAGFASWLDPTNAKARQARMLTDIMQTLGENVGNRVTTVTAGFNFVAPFRLTTASCQEAGSCAAVAAQTPCAASSCGALEGKLREPISVSYKDTPLDQVLTDLHTLSDVNIMVDTRALKDANINLEMPVTFWGKQISLKSTLNILLDQAKLGFIVQDQVLLITTKDRILGQLRLVTYPIEDLLACGQKDVAQCRAETSAVQVPASSMEEKLITLIQLTVAPDTWKDVGGQGTIQFFPLGMALVVSQNQAVQEEISELLASLRRQKEKSASQANPVGAVCAQNCVNAARVECPCDKDCCNASAALAVIKFLAATANCPCPAVGLNQCPFQGVKAITGLTPAGTLMSDLGIPVARCQPDPVTFGGCPATPGNEAAMPFAYGPVVMMPQPMGIPLPPPARGLGVAPLVALPMGMKREYAPPPARGLGVNTPLPSPAQAMLDLEYVRQAAMEQARAETCDGPPSMPTAAKPNVRLVTPQFEATCERLTSVGETGQMLLEGNVELTCKQAGQTLHIQGQCVRVNLTDGTFKVESTPETRPSEMRVRVLSPRGIQVQPASYTVPAPPVYFTPEVYHFKPNNR